MTTLRQFETEVANTTLPGSRKLWVDTFYERITGGKNENVGIAQEGSSLFVEISTRRFITEFLIGPDTGHPSGLTRSFNVLDNEIFNSSPNVGVANELIRDVNRGFIHLGFGGVAFPNSPGVEANVYAPGETTEIFVEQRA